MSSFLRGRFIRRTQAAAAVWLLWCTRDVAAADNAKLRLNWVRGQGAERCASGDALTDALRASIEPSHEHAPPVSIEGLIEMDARQGGFRAHFSVLDAAGQVLGKREIYSPERDCKRATPAVLLVLSVLAELAAADRDAPLPLVDQARDAESPFSQQSVAASEPTSAEPWRLQPLAATGFAFGMSPEASFGVVVGADLHTPSVMSGAFRVMYWPAGQSSFERANGRLGAIDFQVLQAELAACLPVGAPRDFRFEVCWGPTLLMRYVRLIGLPVQHPSLRSTLGLSATVTLAYALSRRWKVQLMSSLIGLSRRDSYVYADTAGEARQVYRESAVAAALSLGFGVLL